MIPAPNRYLTWIMEVRRGPLRVDLTDSGLRTPLSRLGPETGAIPNEPTCGGADDVRAGLARRYGVDPGEVLTALGTSLGVFLAYASVLRPGDRVLVEEPAYETLWRVPETLGARVDRFPRTVASGWRVDPEQVLERWGDDVRVVAVSDLHNPTGRAAGDDGLRVLAAEAERRGAVLLVDEVYRDFRPGPVGTARRLGPAVTAVSSFTKVYGFGDLRAGWVLAAPERVEAMQRWLTMLHVNDPGFVAPLTRSALLQADALRAEALERAAAGRARLEAWLAGRRDVTAIVSDGGIVGWILLPEGWTGTEVAAKLLADHGVAVVPGTMFGDDRGLRVAVGVEPEKVTEGLAALGRVLDELAGAS